MPTALEVTKRQLYSDNHNRSDSEEIPIEDCRFKNFTDFLDEIDVFNNPVTSRGRGIFKKGFWSLLGYSSSSYRQEIEIDDSDEMSSINKSNNNYEIKWEFTLFNGFFTDDVKIESATKQEIEKVVNESKRFLEKTYSNDLINDVSEIRDLQEKLIEQEKNNNLERLDICVITDKVLVDQEKLPTKVKLTSIDIECRVYYWDLQRWDAMKRSKTKREPIDIDFKSSDYDIYEVPYLSKKSGKSLDYFLAIFPGDLIADLYDLYNTKLLENNVRVFLSATKKANKGIRDTIGGKDGKDGSEAYKFFSYNNGISATAESITVDKGHISKIEDFQIVNGGQTTATIHYCRKKKYNLREVFVAVKITALHKGEEYSNIVSKISQAANTQSSIAVSDFYANDKQLVALEQIAMKSPAQDENDRNIYYYFERMKGQYNVLKSSQGTKNSQNAWSKSYPKNLSFTKLDVARWSNMMNGLPYHAAEGSEKQFKTFMDNDNFERVDFHLGSYKSLVGFGSLFRRIRQLCGKANQNLYPSRIIDPATGQHAPVAMSTAIYTASYIHLITEAKFDYWSIFNFKHNLNQSILQPKNNGSRIDSDLDGLLEVFIDAIWSKIAAHGGAAAQEKSKKKECWNFVKKNVKIPKKTLDELNHYMISDDELSKRELIESDDDSIYFNSLKKLLEKKGHILSSMYELSKINSDYSRHKTTISNFIKKIELEDKILSSNRLEKIYTLYDDLINEGFEFSDSKPPIFHHNLNINNIFNEVFKNKNVFINKVYEFVCSDEKFFEENEKLYKEVKDIIDDYYINYGLTVNDLIKLDELIKVMNNS